MAVLDIGRNLSFVAGGFGFAEYDFGRRFLDDLRLPWSQRSGSRQRLAHVHA